MPLIPGQFDNSIDFLRYLPQIILPIFTTGVEISRGRICPGTGFALQQYSVYSQQRSPAALMNEAHIPCLAGAGYA